MDTDVIRLSAQENKFHILYNTVLAAFHWMCNINLLLLIVICQCLDHVEEIIERDNITVSFKYIF